MLKRAFDVTCALIGVVALSPLLLAVAVLVWLSDRGPVIYRGDRVGRDGAPFKMLKFRTMRVRRIEGTAITVRDDPRVTPIGRMLRKVKLDESPQLFNVLRGEMSLVGPRPEAPVYVALYTPQQRRVLSVRPGVTGLAQVVYRDESQLLAGPDPETLYRTVAMPAKLTIDQLYIANQSFFLDLLIIAMTVVVIINPAASEWAASSLTARVGRERSALGNALALMDQEPATPGAEKRHHA